MFNLIANSLDPISQELKDRTISFNGSKLKKKSAMGRRSEDFDDR